ncbi:D-alanyl-D-alanine carboxypeptidase [Streptomyces sp. NPDC006602]|uniref:D-alanyl-D-alanine carboxypeptidase n=1 Tax=Streptomyces sp. NPDC006602 TaxID=3364751 RepID=UPI00368309A8
MEEASVAGESPDRSKQRESSAEPTSGSAGPVPEARTESPDPTEKRDPRLAVARDSTTASTARGGVDTATRVFSVRELTAEAEPAEEAAPDAGEPETAARDAGEPEGAAGATRDTGEAKADAGKPEAGETAQGALEAGTAEGPTEDAAEPEAGETDGAAAGKAAGEPEADAEEAEADEAAQDVTEAETAEEAAEDAVEPQAGDTGGAAAGKAAQGGTAPEADAAEAEPGAAEAEDGQYPAEPRDEDTAQGVTEPEADTADAQAREAAQGATEAETAEEAAEDAVEPQAGDTGTGEVGKTAAEAEPGAAEAEDGQYPAEPREEDTAQGVTEPEADAADAQAEDAGAGGSDAAASGAAGNARLRDAVAAWVASADEETEAGDAKGPVAAETDVDTDQAAGPDADADGPAADERAGHGTDAGTKAGAEPAPKADGAAGGEPDDEPTSGTEPNAGRTDTDTDTDADTDAVAEAADADGTAAPERSGEPGGASGDGRPRVDQPTAVFKAVRPSAPAVDQPTTMLKLGEAGKQAGKQAGDKGESPAERTSKFVALRPLDDPATRKPTAKPADGAAAVPQAKPRADATSPVPQVGPERTTQQPLPPRPPLDLLAELTNTPPPPETPVRTIVRRVKIWTPLVLLLAVVFAIVQAVRPLPAPELTLTADESYTFEGSKADLPWPSEGQGWMDVNDIGTMGDFGKQTPVAIGSVAKAMTAYVVLKDHPLKSGAEGPNIPVDATAEKEGGYDKDNESTLNTVKEGDKLTLRQALAAIMIPSANNIARLLARWDANSEAAFIKKMNDAAKDLGMKNTTYTDASGLKETTVSTAEDQVKLGNELVKMPALMEITSMGQWIDPSGQKWYNYNYLVPYNGAIGIKTGTTTAAGGNLLFAARKEVGGETVTLVGAILGQHKSPIIQTVNDVSKTAMLAAQDEMASAKILKKGDVVGYVDDGLGGRTPVVLTKDVTAVGWAGFKVKLSFDADDLPHSAKAGTKVGTLTVGDGASGAVKVPVGLQKDLVEPGYPDKLTRLG